MGGDAAIECPLITVVWDHRTQSWTVEAILHLSLFLFSIDVMCSATFPATVLVKML